MDKTLNEEVFNDYIERKKSAFRETFKHSQFIDYSKVEEFLSDMAQEIFGCLPLERMSWLDHGDGSGHPTETPRDTAFNSCRSTFLENIKKLK